MKNILASFFSVLYLFLNASPDTIRIATYHAENERHFNYTWSQNKAVIESIRQIVKKPIKIYYADSQDNVIDAVKKGIAHIGINNISSSFDRVNDSIVFSVPYDMNKYMMIGHLIKKESFFKVILMPQNIFKFLSLIAAILFLYGNIIWFFEHKNENSIHSTYFPGIFEAIYQAFNIVAKLNVDQSRILNSTIFTRFFSIPIWLFSIVLISVLVNQINIDILNKDKEEYLITEKKQISNYPIYALRNTLAESIGYYIGDSTKLKTFSNLESLFQEYLENDSALLIIKDIEINEATKTNLIKKNSYTVHLPNIKTNRVVALFNSNFYFENEGVCDKVNVYFLKYSLTQN